MKRLALLLAVTLAATANACPACAASQASRHGHPLWPLVLAMMFIPFAVAVSVGLLVRRQVKR